MKIVNRTQGTLLGSRVVVADTWWRRFRGFLGRREPASGEGILLVPCSSIHTFGMAFPLDVIFLDEEGRVLGTRTGVSPWRVARGRAGTRYVLEVPAGTVEATHTSVGDTLSWVPKQQVVWWSNPVSRDDSQDPTSIHSMRTGER